MKYRVFTLFSLAALAVLVAASMAQAALVPVYSENFEGASVGDGLVANLGWSYWTEWGTSLDIVVGSNVEPGNPTKATDGDAGATNYHVVSKALTIPEDATALHLAFDFYGKFALGVWGSRFGFATNPPDYTTHKEASWIYSYRNGETWDFGTAGGDGPPTYSSGGATAGVMDQWAHATIDADLVNMTSRGVITGTGGTLDSGLSTLTAVPGSLIYVSNLKNGNCGLNIDNIVVTAEVPASGLFGTITLNHWLSPTGDSRLTPVRVELLDSSTGHPVFDQMVHLVGAEYNHYEVGLYGLPSGTYNVYFTAVKWLRKLAAANLVINQGDVKEVNAALTNGDLDGDNEVTSTDLSVVLTNVGVTGDW